MPSFKKSIAAGVRVAVFAVAAIGVGASSANAATIGTFAFGAFLQEGEFTNQFGQTAVQVSIHFVPDAGNPRSPLWELPPPVGPGSPGTPPAVFTDINLDGRGAFTATFGGLSVAGGGGTFEFSGLDYGANELGVTSEAFPPALLGDEFARVVFADGSSVSAVFDSGSVVGGAFLVFDDQNLVPANPVPLPPALPLLAAGLGFVMLAGRRRRV